MTDICDHPTASVPDKYETPISECLFYEWKKAIAERQEERDFFDWLKTAIN